MVDVACFAATAAPPTVRMTSTLSRTNSAAISEKRSLRPSAQRYSIATVRPSVQPSSRSLCTKTADQRVQAEGVLAPRNPMVGSLPGCCARAASGHVIRAAEKRDDVASPHGHPSSGLGPHITTPLRKNAAVHDSKNCALMSQMGHNRLTEGCPRRVRFTSRNRHKSPRLSRPVSAYGLRAIAPRQPLLRTYLKIV